MKTQVIMQREVNDMQNQIFNGCISQQSKTGYFSATDLVKFGNRYREKNNLSKINLTQWLNLKGTKEYIKSLEVKIGEKVVKKGRGRTSTTWVHPYLFIDLALTISPDLKVEVYGWLYDHLLEYRNTSGDSYKKMCGAIYHSIKDKKKFGPGLPILAKQIKKVCNVDDWQQATEKQLKLRNRIHENIALLCDVLPVNEAVRIGIKKAID